MRWGKQNTGERFLFPGVASAIIHPRDDAPDGRRRKSRQAWPAWPPARSGTRARKRWFGEPSCLHDTAHKSNARPDQRWMSALLPVYMHTLQTSLAFQEERTERVECIFLPIDRLTTGANKKLFDRFVLFFPIMSCGVSVSGQRAAGSGQRAGGTIGQTGLRTTDWVL